MMTLTGHNGGMSNNNTIIRMKGAPVAVYAKDESVIVWVASPTGDASDSFQYTIPCVNEQQAEVIAEMWRTTWGIPRY